MREFFTHSRLEECYGKEVLELLRKLDTVSKSSVYGTLETYTLSEGRV